MQQHGRLLDGITDELRGSVDEEDALGRAVFDPHDAAAEAALGHPLRQHVVALVGRIDVLARHSVDHLDRVRDDGRAVVVRARRQPTGDEDVAAVW